MLLDARLFFWDRISNVLIFELHLWWDVQFDIFAICLILNWFLNISLLIDCVLYLMLLADSNSFLFRFVNLRINNLNIISSRLLLNLFITESILYCIFRSYSTRCFDRWRNETILSVYDLIYFHRLFNRTFDIPFWL